MTCYFHSMPRDRSAALPWPLQDLWAISQADCKISIFTAWWLNKYKVIKNNLRHSGQALYYILHVIVLCTSYMYGKTSHLHNKQRDLPFTCMFFMKMSWSFEIHQDSKLTLANLRNVSDFDKL